FALTIPLVFWDSGFLLMRPRSMVGGDLHFLWKPYAIYQNVDRNYGVQAYEKGHGFPNAQAFLTLVENFMNIGYLWLVHAQGSPAAPLLGFASALMTLSKTALYWLIEYYCGGCSIMHNDLQTLVAYWVLPMGLWLLVPACIVWRLGQDIATVLHAA
ncbi:predicted protein, partial [Postia placenta Mad-698-R]